MLCWIKELARDPFPSGASRSSIQSLRNQTLEAQKVMALTCTELPWRKWKSQQFLKDEFAYLCKSAPKQHSTEQDSGKQLSHASSDACLLSSVDSSGSFKQRALSNSYSSSSSLTFEDNLPGKQVPIEFSPLENAVNCLPIIKDYSPLPKSDCSVDDSMSTNSKDIDDSVYSSNSSNSEGSGQKYLHTPRRSTRLANFIDDHLQRMDVRVGASFQAEIPQLSGLDGNSENSRWLGTRVWPIEGRYCEVSGRRVGKGRPDSCACVSPGSSCCTELHILGERLILQSDLGPAFSSWKFDEMGEEVSNSWTMKEQERFESLARMYPLSKGKNVLKHALKCFPLKSREIIRSYYFNVFLPRRISKQTKLPREQDQR